MRVLLLTIAIFVLVSGCNTTARMEVPTVVQPEPVEFNTSDIVPFAFQGAVSGMRFGSVIAHFPAEGVPGISSSLCNYSYTGEVTLTLNNGSRHLSGWNDEMHMAFFEVMKSQGFDVVGDPTNLFDYSDERGRAEFAIGARIKDMSGNFCEDHDFWYGYPQDRYAGEMFMEVEWTIFNTTMRQEKNRITTTGYFKVRKSSRTGMLEAIIGAFSAATESLGSNKDFIKALSKETVRSDVVASVPLTDEAIYIPEISLSTQPFEDHVRRILPSVVTIRAGGGHGSGFVISEDGYILSNQHVVGDFDTVLVRFENGVEIDAAVIRRHEGRDVALLKIPLRGLRALPMNLELPGIATEAVVVGSPADEELYSTVTRGSISALRKFSYASGGTPLLYIQSDVAITGGNSGGPMFDKDGNVIGITVLEQLDADDVNFFIPIDDALKFLNIKQTPGSS
jgi:serine protease Do